MLVYVWEQRKLGEIVSFKDVDHWMPKTVKNGIPYIMTGDFLDNGKIDFKNAKRISLSDYQKLSQKAKPIKGDTILARYASVGAVRLVKNNERFLPSYSCTIIHPSRNIKSLFLYQSLQTIKLQYQIKINTKTGSQANIGIKDLKEFIEISLPTLKEQKNIDDLLKILDNLLVLQQRKLNKLKLIKKAILEEVIDSKLLIKNKKLRTEKVKISDIFKVTRGKVLSTKKIKDKPDNINKYPVYSSQTMNDGLLGFYNKYLFENAITWTTDGANAGTVRYRSGKFYSTNVNGVLLSYKGYSNEIIADILNTITPRYVSHVGNPKLMNNVMSDIKINIPISLSDQKAISLILNNLHKNLQFNNKKMNDLKTIKQFLLQNMFI